YAYSGGPDVANWATLVAMPAAFDLALLQEYDSYRRDQRFKFAAGMGADPAVSNPVVRTVATVGQLLGTGPTLGSPLSALATQPGSSAVHDAAVARTAAAAVLAGTNPDPAGASSIPYPFTNTRRPLEAIKPFLESELHKRLAEDIF